ncbi:Manganese/iron superoxide dismutase [Sesbania bispinosa]|nr:Manganese/iron superoxide dismutase [Sesbania bispinosa]
MASSGLQHVNLLYTQGNKVTPEFELKPPPYSLNALEPIMSIQTLEYHWGKHHRAYVENLKKQVVGTGLEGRSLEDIIVTSYNKGDILPAFNNAAQVWNHDFFWECMKPGGGGRPTGDLLGLIERDFGSFEKFLDEFKAAAATQFGSGGLGLHVNKASRFDTGDAANIPSSDEDNKLVVLKSPNAPLLTIDVWEHAYYLDYQVICCSKHYTQILVLVTEKLVSWDAVSSRLEHAKAVLAKADIHPAI